jgi:hypothetical protein
VGPGQAQHGREYREHSITRREHREYKRGYKRENKREYRKGLRIG